jgi:hypothetical protein
MAWNSNNVKAYHGTAGGKQILRLTDSGHYGCKLFGVAAASTPISVMGGNALTTSDNHDAGGSSGVDLAGLLI